MTTDRDSLPFTVSGHGEPVVILDWTPWETTALESAFKPAYRVVSVGLPAEPEPVDVLAARVASLVGLAGLSKYALVGTSLGADVALHMALLRPESVTALVVVSPTCVAPSATAPWHTPDLAASAMLAHPKSPGMAAADPVRTAKLAALAELWRGMGVDKTGRLAEVPCATLAVIGQEDRLVSREAGGIWKAEVPNCSISYVYDAGHAIAVERPDALDECRAGLRGATGDLCRGEPAERH